MDLNNNKMKKELKEKLMYWTEVLLYLGGLSLGFSILVGGLYSLYVILKAVFG